MAREIKKRSVVQQYKSTEEDDKLVGIGLKLTRREKREIDEKIAELNRTQNPIPKITLVSYLRKGRKLLDKQLEKKNFEDI